MWLGFILVFLIIGPFLTIWALNTLFPALAIPYSLDTWAAVILIKGLLTVQVTNK
jgi:hypothetical protein